MTLHDKLRKFDRAGFETLMETIYPRIISFHDKGPGIILRHDVDAWLLKTFNMLDIENGFGVTSTSFLLNTADYWETLPYPTLRHYQGQGHEFGWHNNVITEWIKMRRRLPMEILIQQTLEGMRQNMLTVRGTASHGDPMCYVYHYVNYQVWDTFLKDNELDYDQLPLDRFGLEYEAYATERDVYLSDSGHKWASEVKEEDLLNPDNRVQILIHPQHWSLL